MEFLLLIRIRWKLPRLHPPFFSVGERRETRAARFDGYTAKRVEQFSRRTAHFKYLRQLCFKKWNKSNLAVKQNPLWFSTAIIIREMKIDFFFVCLCLLIFFCLFLSGGGGGVSVGFFPLFFIRYYLEVNKKRKWQFYFNSREMWFGHHLYLVAQAKKMKKLQF